MPRLSLDEIFNEPDEFGLLAVSPRSALSRSPTDASAAIVREVTAFYERHGRLPNPDGTDHEDMRLGTIWARIAVTPTDNMRAEDRLGLLAGQPAIAQPSWRDEPTDDDIPANLDDIFDDDDIDAGPDVFALKNVTPASERLVPDHRAESMPCRDFNRFHALFEDIQTALDSGDRVATPIEARAVIEPLEGDFFIRNGLLAYIAEKSEMSVRGGARDHRLRVIFSNGMESDPLMKSFRKSLNDDRTARVIQRSGLGPLDPDWESDKLELSGTIYVARTLSQDPKLAAERNILHKIGVTSQDVRRRVADARNDPTFLLAPVEVVSTFELKNLARSKVEALLHRFFAAARPGELFITDRFGKKIHPREWFYVLPDHVSQAANLLREGNLHLYRYDLVTQKIVTK
jgi:hypothetical protein